MVFQALFPTHTRSRANIGSHRAIGKSSMFAKRTPKEIFVDLYDTHNETSSPKMLQLDVTAERFVTSGPAKRYGSPASLVPGSPSFLTCSRELSRFPTPGLCTAATTATDCLSVPPTPTITSYNIVVTPRILRTEDFVGLKRLGEGGHGKVFLVQDKVTSGLFALKVIEKDGLHISSYARIFEEQMIMKVLEGCERCVTVKGSFQDHENFYILTDFFSGRDLRRCIARGVLSTGIIRRYMSELVLALDELHSRQIIHRDIKPDNILIDHEGHLHIADFGISRIFGRPSGDKPWESLRTWRNAKDDQKKTAVSSNRTQSPDMTFTPCGTPGFLPPEVYDHQYSYPVDIWCLGIVFHIMLLGGLPFGLIPGNQRSAEMKERTQKLPVKIGEDEHIHPDAEDLLRKMLDKDPAKRITLEQMRVHPFFKIIDWKNVPKGTHDGSAIPKQMFSSRTTANDVPIPVGTAYEPGLVPFPWFEHVSSQMQEVEPADAGGAHPTADPISTLLEADIHDLELPVTEAPVSTKFTRRLKHWWKKRHTMEVKAGTEGERIHC